MLIIHNFIEFHVIGGGVNVEPYISFIFVTTCTFHRYFKSGDFITGELFRFEVLKIFETAYKVTFFRTYETTSETYEDD